MSTIEQLSGGPPRGKLLAKHGPYLWLCLTPRGRGLVLLSTTDEASVGESVYLTEPVSCYYVGISETAFLQIANGFSCRRV